MCQIAQDTMDKLTKTVRQFLDEGRMFTGYDVTIETRTREGMSLRHQDVRGAVHEIEELNDAMDFGHDGPNGTTKWAKSQKNMPSGWAFVYHPANLDPNQYQPRNTTATNSIGTAPPQGKLPIPPSLASNPNLAVCPQPMGLTISLATDGATTDSGGEQDDGTFVTDYRDRLMIPTRFMKDAGIKAGDFCFVIPDATNNMVLICKDNPNVTGYNITTQKVEKDGELRLSSKTLKSADLSDSKFVIETTDRTLGSSSVKVVAIKKSDVATAKAN